MNSEMSRGKKVFISYARVDREHASRLYADLEKAGLEPWLDEESIRAGENWKAAIDRAIGESDFFLALLSSRSVDKKGYVQKELRRALDELDKYPENKIYLIPARLDECQPSHSKLFDLHRVDLFPSYEAGFEKLLRSFEDEISPRGSGAEVTLEPAAPPRKEPPVVHGYRRVVRTVAGWGIIAMLAGFSGHGPPPSKPPPANQSTGAEGKSSKELLPVIAVDGGEAGKSLLENLQGLGFPAEVSLKLDDIGLELVLIRKGSYLMGTPPTESGRELDETQHRVVISRPLYIGKYEVTQEQFAKVMTGFFHLNQFDGRDQNPVEKVSWNEAREFCQRLSAQLKGSIRLPTEAEWEYACRAGTNTPFHEGREMEHLGKVAWYKDNSDFETHPVGGKAPNAWGLYDMHGNVKEWCQDWYSETLGTNLEAVDPQGPQTGIYRVSRGGGIRSDPRFCRSGYRGSALPDRKDHDRGFRVVVALREPAELP
jgi:formylglycine-generating enzyme required for sulfatase activity